MNRIKELRNERSWQQVDLAQMLNVAKSTISRYETETHAMDPKMIDRLCDLFGVTSDYLLGRSTVKNPYLPLEDYAVIAAYHAADPDHRLIVDTALGLHKVASDENEKSAAG